MKRLRIQDCFTIPYNGNLIKTFQNKIELRPLFKVKDWWKFEEQFEEELPDFENDEISKILDTHYIGPITELYALEETKRIRDVSSAPVEYVSAYETHKPKFKKVAVSTEETYHYPGIGFFEKLSSNVLRHIGRLNGENILLAESCIWYDVLTKKQSLEFIALYREKIDRIPPGNVVGISGETLPTYIICDSNQMLKLRKNRKVLQLPEFLPLSRERKYARVLLFYPLRRGQKIDPDRLGI